MVSHGRDAEYVPRLFWAHDSSGNFSMRLIWITTCLAIILIAGQAVAADRAQKAKTAEHKAQVLEQDAAAAAAMRSRLHLKRSQNPGRRRSILRATNPWTTRSPAWPAPSIGRHVAKVSRAWRQWPASS